MGTAITCDLSSMQNKTINSIGTISKEKEIKDNSEKIFDYTQKTSDNFLSKIINIPNRLKEKENIEKLNCEMFAINQVKEETERLSQLIKETKKTINTKTQNNVIIHDKLDGNKIEICEINKKKNKFSWKNSNNTKDIIECDNFGEGNQLLYKSYFNIKDGSVKYKYSHSGYEVTVRDKNNDGKFESLRIKNKYNNFKIKASNSIKYYDNKGNLIKDNIIEISNIENTLFDNIPTFQIHNAIFQRYK